jgi:hypothetical protein
MAYMFGTARFIHSQKKFIFLPLLSLSRFSHLSHSCSSFKPRTHEVSGSVQDSGGGDGGRRGGSTTGNKKTTFFFFLKRKFFLKSFST